MRRCSDCGARKELSEYWNSKYSADGKDSVCAECRERKKREREATPEGIYELQARLVMSIYRRYWFPNVDPSEFQIDHKFSIRNGYRLDVPLRVITNRANLQLLTPTQNRKKGSKNSIGLAQLFREAVTDKQHSRWCEIIGRQTNPETLRRWAKYVREKYKCTKTV